MQQDQESDSPNAEHVSAGSTDALLSIGEAAARLGTSTAYVTMLLDKGRLGEVVETPGGRRRVQAWAVDAYLERQLASKQGVKDFREVARDIGMYDIAEEHYTGYRRDVPDATS